MTERELVMAPLFHFMQQAAWPCERINLRLTPTPEFKALLDQLFAGESLTAATCRALPEFDHFGLGVFICQHYYHLLDGQLDPAPYLQDTSAYEIGAPLLQYLQQRGWLY